MRTLIHTMATKKQSSTKVPPKPKTGTCKDGNCELIDSTRVRVICKGDMGKLHNPAFLFSEIMDREFLNHHLVSVIIFLKNHDTNMEKNLKKILSTETKFQTEGHMLCCGRCGCPLTCRIAVVREHCYSSCHLIESKKKAYVCRTHGTVSIFLIKEICKCENNVVCQILRLFPLFTGLRRGIKKSSSPLAQHPSNHVTQSSSFKPFPFIDHINILYKLKF